MIPVLPIRCGLLVVLVAAAVPAQELVQDRPRLQTSRKRLFVRWRSPVSAGDDRLDFGQALGRIRGKDPRPLLVLRDDEDAARKAQAFEAYERNHEVTLLLAQWFHCVKISRRVRDESHPWHALFPDPSVFLLLATADGSTVLRVDRIASPRRLQAQMTKILRAEYRKDPTAAVKRWVRLLDRLDVADADEKDLVARFQEAKEKGRARRAKRFGVRLAKVRKDRAAALAQEKVLVALGLRHAPKVKSVLSFDDDAAAEVRAGNGGGLLDRVHKETEKAKETGKSGKPDPGGPAGTGKG